MGLKSHNDCEVHAGDEQMIIDSHAHVVMTDALYRYMGELVASRANPAGPFAGVGEAALHEVSGRLLSIMDGVGTDIQFLSPRPYMMMHSSKSGRVTGMWTRAVNNAIHAQCKLHPDRFRGVAGLPQFRADSPANCLSELQRSVEALRFVG